MKQLFFLLSFLTSTMLTAQNIAGSWNGNLEIQGAKLAIVFHIEKTDAGYSTKMDSPNQGAFGLSTSKTTFANNQLEIVASALGMKYTGTLEGDSIKGLFAQRNISLPLVLKQSTVNKPKRPQEPKAPYPYTVEDVVFENKSANIKLSGTLTTPSSNETFPAIILIAGSGSNDRDETVFGHKPFLVLADYLTRNGFAVLRYDKRGVAQSEGDYAKAITADFASDVEAAILFLRSHKNVDKSRIALIGHSEGGLIAPMIAAKDKNIRAIILMAGPGVTGSEILLEQNRWSMEAQGVEKETIDKILHEVKETHAILSEWKGTENDKTILKDKLGQVWDSMPIMLRMKTNREQHIASNYNSMISPWLRNFLVTDPSTYLAKVRCSVFVINGEKDFQVSAIENVDAIRKALDKGKNKRYETKIYPGLNHLFQTCVSGGMDEYSKIEETMSPEVLSDISQWLKRVLNTK